MHFWKNQPFVMSLISRNVTDTYPRLVEQTPSWVFVPSSKTAAIAAKRGRSNKALVLGKHYNRMFFGIDWKMGVIKAPKAQILD